MKKMLTSLLVGFALFFGSYSATEAAETVNGYEIVIAVDGCRIYTNEAMKRFVDENKAQKVNDEIFIATMQHIRHAAFK